MGFAANTLPTNSSGSFFINPAYARLIDCYKITQKGCVVRFYPALNEAGNPIPNRTGPEPSDITWVSSFYGIEFIGGGEASKQKISTFLHVDGDERQDDPAQRKGIMLWSRICDTLYSMTSSGTAPPNWAAWVADKADSAFGPRQKSKPKMIAVAMGALFLYNNSRGALKNVSMSNPKLNVLFTMGPNAQSGLVKLLQTPAENAETYNGDDWTRRFKYESHVVDTNQGCLIEFGRPGQELLGSNNSAAPTIGNVNFNNFGGSPQRDMQNQFAVDARIRLDMKVPVPIDTLRKIVAPLNKVVRTHKDEKSLLAVLERGVPDALLLQTFQDSPHLLSDMLREKLKRFENGVIKSPGTTVVVDGNSGHVNPSLPTIQPVVPPISGIGVIPTLPGMSYNTAGTVTAPTDSMNSTPEQPKVTDSPDFADVLNRMQAIVKQ